MSAKLISVAKQFSRFPAGRTRSDGDFSGERFREDLLFPALASGNEVTVDLDGAAGYGSSFLEEAFGGLVRVHQLSLADLTKRLHVQSADVSYLLEIWSYITEAAKLKGEVAK